MTGDENRDLSAHVRAVGRWAATVTGTADVLDLQSHAFKADPARILSCGVYLGSLYSKIVSKLLLLR